MSPEMFERLVWIGVILAIVIVNKWLGLDTKKRLADVLESVEAKAIDKVLVEPAAPQVQVNVQPKVEEKPNV